MWGPQTIAKLVQITPIAMVYDTYIYLQHFTTIVNGIYKPSYNWGGPLCLVGGFNPSEKY